MKGMLDFLEKAGLVKNDTPAAPTPVMPAQPQSEVPSSQTAAAADPPHLPLGQALDLEGIYANSGVAPSIYPAERLLRLLDGLSAMDEATRLMAIKAMDAADESWSIQDPLADAATKLAALAIHTDQLKNNLKTVQDHTKSSLDAIAERTEQVVGDIRKQIAELEALAARAQSRALQESTEQQSTLNAMRDQTARGLNDIQIQRQRLQGLATLFHDTPRSSAKD